MATNPSAFLVARRDDGFGEVFPLQTGTRYTLGRAPTNRIVLRDDLCSREHSEVFPDEGGWFVRDLSSLNGTHLNGEQLRKEKRLRPLDELRVGRTQLVFTEDLNELPDLPQSSSPGKAAEKGDGLEIKKRLGSTRYFPTTGTTREPETAREETRVAPNAAVAVLYKLALEMADATTRRNWPNSSSTRRSGRPRPRSGRCWR